MTLSTIIRILAGGTVILVLHGCYPGQDNNTLLQQIDDYSNNIDLSYYKNKLVQLVSHKPAGQTGGVQPGKAAQIIDDITVETKRYLRDVAAMLSGPAGDGGLQESFSKTFGMYKQMVEQDVPRLAPGGKPGAKLQLNEGELQNALNEVQRKNNMIKQQLQEIERKAADEADKIQEQAAEKAKKQMEEN